MLTKAGLMGDKETFKQIAEAKDPASCKALGRRVRPFDGDLWEEHLRVTAFEVVQQKFASDPKLKEVLLSTGDAVIAEATRNDKIWGIGIDVGDPRVNDTKQWLGRNVLGYALMEAREHLRKQDQSNEVHSASETVVDLTQAESPNKPCEASEDAPARSRWKRREKQ